jgi:iron complex transport system ATP-binding protein
LRGIDVHCPVGSHTAILGPNGAGKTSLLRAVSGLIPFEGAVTWQGTRLDSLSAGERARCISYVPQRSLLDSALSVAEVVAQGRYAHQGALGRRHSADTRAVVQALEVTDTTALRHVSYLRLSGGEQRRVLLARALATEAPVLVLDEPTTSLDLAHALQFFAQLRALCQAGRTILTILHDLRDAERFCDRAVLLANGQPQYTGGAALPAEVVREVYGVDPVRQGATRFDLVGGAP